MHLRTGRVTQILAKAILRMTSWRLDVTIPTSPKYVLIGAPHTTGWDLIHGILLMHATGSQFHWAAKDELFRWPLGGFLRWLGGIPVNRRVRTNFVQQIVDAFNRADALGFAITPEGTRARAAAWKTGFYYIALGAGVPIALGFVDYRTRTLGIGPTVVPTGDIHADFAQIRAFYEHKLGRYPDRQGVIGIDPQ